MKKFDNTVYCGRRIRLYPTMRQRERLLQFIDLYRYVYNWAKAQYDDYCEKHKEDTDNRKLLSFYDLCSLYTKSKQNDRKLQFLNEIKFPIGTARYAIKDLLKAYNMYYLGHNRRPRFKRKHDMSKHSYSFKIRSDRSYIHNGKVRIEGFPIGDMIDIRTNKFNGYDGRPINKHTGHGYCDVNISYDRITDEFWLSFGYEHFVEDTTLIDKPQTEGLGVDLGHRRTFILSNGEMYTQPRQKNTHKLISRLDTIRSKDYKRDKKIIRKQIAEGKTNPYYVEKSKRRIKRDKRRLKAYQKIHNVKQDFYTKIIRDIVLRNPKIIGIETIQVKDGLQYKKNVWKNMYDTSFYTIRILFEQFCNKYNVQLHESHNQFPSSQLCNCCGNRYNIRIDEYTYKCPTCGYIEDRDINAAKNLLDDALGREFIY